jgi:hypothetical protein
MGKLSRFQKQSFQGWKGDVLKKHHMSAIFLREPQRATNLMVQLLAWHKGKTLDTFLSQFPTKTFDNDEEYVWNVIGSARKNYPLVEARDINGNVITSGNAGVAGEPFYLVFKEDWIGDSEVIVGELNEAYPIRHIDDIRRNEGTNVVYKVEMWGSVRTGIPADQLQPGRKFSVEYAPVEGELSRKAGTVRFSSPISMRNEFSHIRIHTKVSGALLNDKVAFGIPVVRETVNGGKKDTVDMWMHEVQWQLEQQWNEYKNYILAFGRSNRDLNGEYHNYGKSGEAIRTGAGLFEQMEYGNTSFYNDFSLKAFMDNLYSISRANLDFSQRKFVVKTGELGAIQFSRAAMSEGSGWSPITYEYDAAQLGLMQKTQSKMNPWGGAYKLVAPQITEFIAPNGAFVQIDVDPFYDDPVRNKIQHYLGGPAMSYRYDIFDIGTMDQPNIFKVAVKGQEGDFTSYEWGFRNPFTGQMGNPNMSHDEDSATIHKYTTTGVCVLDPTRTLSYIPAVLQG